MLLFSTVPLGMSFPLLTPNHVSFSSNGTAGVCDLFLRAGMQGTASDKNTVNSPCSYWDSTVFFFLNKCLSVFCLWSILRFQDWLFFDNFVQFYCCFWWRGFTKLLTSNSGSPSPVMTFWGCVHHRQHPNRKASQNRFIFGVVAAHVGWGKGGTSSTDRSIFLISHQHSKETHKEIEHPVIRQRMRLVP